MQGQGQTKARCSSGRRLRTVVVKGRAKDFLAVVTQVERVIPERCRKDMVSISDDSGQMSS